MFVSKLHPVIESPYQGETVSEKVRFTLVFILVESNIMIIYY